MDLILEARAWVNGELRDVEIGIEEGRIAAVKKALTGSPRVRHRGLLLLPSGVDWHVHMRDPGAPQKEDFKTGTTAAALGGVGTVFDMPNTSPTVDRPSRLEEKVEKLSPKAVVDWGLWATITPQTTQRERLLREANGIKLYLAPTTSAEASFDDPQLADVIEQAQEAKRWVLVHAESPPGARIEEGTRDHDLNRPPEGEVASIRNLRQILTSAEGIHIAHATTRQAVDAALEAGFNVGVTPHHLLLSYEGLSQSYGKVNPPIRSESHRAALWSFFASGPPVQVESDHAPHTTEEKGQRFHEAPSGVPGVETMLPLLLHAAKQGEVELGHVIAAACERPATALGLDRGFLAVGKKADFFLVDPREPRPIRGDRLASRCGWTPFEGRSALFPTIHYLDGEVVVEDGSFVGRAGRGKRIRPTDRPRRVERSHHKR